MGSPESDRERSTCASCGRPVSERQYRRQRILSAGHRVSHFFCNPSCANAWEAEDALQPTSDDSITRAAAVGLGDPQLDRAFRHIAGYLSETAQELPDMDARDWFGFISTSIRSVVYGEAYNIFYAREGAVPAMEVARSVLARGRPTPVAKEYQDLVDALIVASEAVLDQTCPGWREGQLGPQPGTGS